MAAPVAVPPNCPERGRIGREIAETVQTLIHLRAHSSVSDAAALDISAASERLRQLRLEYRHHTKEHKCAERTPDPS
jgi:hypothetical protein